MPFIRAEISVSLNDSQIETLKDGFTQIIRDVTGKSENYLMIKIGEARIMFFAGTGGEAHPAAHIEVRLLGNIELNQKEEIVSRIGNLLKFSANIPLNRTYITILELERENWGYNGKTFAS